MDEAAAEEAATTIASPTAGDRSPHTDDTPDGAGDDPVACDIEVEADVARIGAGRDGRLGQTSDEPGSGPSDEAEVAIDEDDAADEGGGASGEEVCHRQALSARVEALLLASDRPMTESRLAEVCGLPRAGATARIRAALAELAEFHRASGRSFRPRKVAGGWQLVTLPAFGPLMARLHRDRQETRLSPAAMETLSIIAYRQPVLRAELEAIRGVACGEVLRSLMERRLVSIMGRSEDMGRPMLYGTTRQFLEVFGLSSLEDLPEVAGLERRRTPRPAVTPLAVDAAEDGPEDFTEPEADHVLSDGLDAADAPDAPDAPDAAEPASIDTPLESPA